MKEIDVLQKKKGVSGKDNYDHQRIGFKHDTLASILTPHICCWASGPSVGFRCDPDA